jgi:hypothetical protein
LVYETIDHISIGRWINGVDGRRTLTPRQIISNGVSGQHFCNCRKLNVACLDSCRRDECQSLACEIRSAAALKQYLNQNKGKIKNKKNEILGIKQYKFFERKSVTISDLIITTAVS